jgi:hypothetical protein
MVKSPSKQQRYKESRITDANKAGFCALIAMFTALVELPEY